MWQPTAITCAMATEGIAAGHRTWYVMYCFYLPFLFLLFDDIDSIPKQSGNTTVEAGQKAPKYFSEAGYRCPTDPRDGLMQYALQTKLTTFEYMNAIPHILKDFNTFMGNTLGARKYWTDWFPVQNRLIDGANETSPLLVDVGGGKGHDLLEFQAKFPQKPGRLALQDLSPVTSNLGVLDPAIKPMTYDFFSDQPIKGKATTFVSLYFPF